ncbi:MAG: hypothetical protein ACF8LK_04880, partial [Phycisphaerales bacterium JB041]
MTTPNATLQDQIDGTAPKGSDTQGTSQDTASTASGGAAASPAPESAAVDAPPRKGTGKKRRKQKRSLFVRMEAFVSRLSTRNTCWHRVCSLIWLPYAFHSGI